MEQARKQIKKALRDLGEKGAVKIIRIAPNRFRVMLKGKYFGTFDTVRNTFVD